MVTFVGTPGNILAMGDAAVTVDVDKAYVLPQTAQVAAQQGAYLARLLNRGYDITGGTKSYRNNNTNANTFQEHNMTTASSIFLDQPINHEAATEGDVMSKVKLRGAVKAKPFQFLNLGQLAYLGGGDALSQVQLGDIDLFNQAGSVGFLLWRSVYIVKQVSTKTRLLVLFDWFSTKIFGRDVTRM